MADANAMSVSIDDAPVDLVVTQSGITYLVTGLIPIATWIAENPNLPGIPAGLRNAIHELTEGLRMSGLAEFFKKLPND